MALLMSKLHQWLLNEFTIIMFPYNFIVFFVATIFLVYLLKQYTRRDHVDLPPSPPKLPIIGNLHQIGKQLHRKLHALSEKYGPMMTLHLGSTTIIVVSSAEIIEEIIKRQDVIFSGRPRKRSLEIFFSGNMGFSQYNDYFRFARKICAFQLLNTRKFQAFQFVREEETGLVLDKLKLACRNENVVDLNEISVSLASIIIARSAFGRVLNYNCESIAKSLKEGIRLSFGFWVGDYFPYLGWMDDLTGNARSLKNIRKELYTFLDRVIEDHESLKPDEHKLEEKDFVDILLDIQQDPTVDIRLTRKNINALLLDIFTGGTETVASTMEWAMAELMKNPCKMNKAQEEVRRVVGQKSRVDEKDVNEMKYLKLVIKETLRLHPPLLLPRVTSESTVLCGYNIPSKTQFLINVWAIQRDPKLWEKPDEFSPERFTKVDVDARGTQSHLIPFGFGRRTCPGITHGDAVVEYVLANLLYWFDWKLPFGKDFDMNDSYQSLIPKKKSPASCTSTLVILNFLVSISYLY